MTTRRPTRVRSRAAALCAIALLVGGVGACGADQANTAAPATSAATTSGPPQSPELALDQLRIDGLTQSDETLLAAIDSVCTEFATSSRSTDGIRAEVATRHGLTEQDAGYVMKAALAKSCRQYMKSASIRSSFGL